MSGQVSRGSAGEYQVDERAGVARLHWRVSALGWARSPLPWSLHRPPAEELLHRLLCQDSFLMAACHFSLGISALSQLPHLKGAVM